MGQGKSLGIWEGIRQGRRNEEGIGGNGKGKGGATGGGTEHKRKTRVRKTKGEKWGNFEKRKEAGI